MSYIIVKYAHQHTEQRFYQRDSVFGTYSANECGVTAKNYASPEEAKDDLEKLRQFNPSVDYGIVELYESAKASAKKG